MTKTTVLNPATRSRALVSILFLAVCSLHAGVAKAQVKYPVQHFACDSGYTQQQCGISMQVVKNALARYPVRALGDWTWVLVRPEDWKRFLLDRGFDPNPPAFSYLPKRETFLDGSLVVKVSIRGFELREQWHMPIEDLLDLAIRHEIAHALCNDRDEIKAGLAASALKNGSVPSCRIPLR